MRFLCLAAAVVVGAVAFSASAALPGRNGLLVFVRDGGTNPDVPQYDIWVGHADGSGVRRLTRSPSPEDQPAWSPNGRRIAFMRAGSLYSDDYALFVMNADGSRAKRITGYCICESPTWSPDGRWIAFTNARLGIVVIRADGRKRRVIPRTVDLCGDLCVSAWSPDGRTLALGLTYERFNYQTGAGGGLWLISARGGKPRRLTQTRDPDADLDPTWSPDGRTVAFAHVTNPELPGERWEIQTIGRDGRGLRTLGAFVAESPAFSPDGRFIVLEGLRVIRARDGALVTDFNPPRGEEPDWQRLRRPIG